MTVEHELQHAAWVESNVAQEARSVNDQALIALANELRRYRRLDQVIPRSAVPETLEECHALIRMMDIEVVDAQEDLRQERAERKWLAAENERLRAEIAPSTVDSG